MADLSIRCLFIRILALSIGIGAALLPCGVQASDGPDGNRVLVVHSYHETQKGHVVEMDLGIAEAFAGSNADLRYVYMDTKRKNDLAWKRQAGILAAREMDLFRPRVVIAMDDNAQAFFVKDNMNRDNAPAFVFGGVNADISTYGYPRPNVTGVLERPNIKESLDLLLKIKPDIKSVLMISDKSSTTDSFVKYSKTLDLPIKVVGYVQARTLEEWETAIEKYRGLVDAFGVYVLRTIKGKTDGTVSESRLVEILNQKGRLPTVGFFDTAAESGLLCGISVSMKAQGWAAGQMARSILEGRFPEDIPIGPTRNGRIQLNLKTAERLGLAMDWNIISKADVVIK